MSNEIEIKSNSSNPLVMVPTYINDQGPFDFVLDTGASVTVLSKEFAQSLGIGDGEVKQGIGALGSAPAMLSKVESLAIGTHEQKDMEVAVMDLPSLGKCFDGGFRGIIGYNFLKNYSVTVDYPGSVLRLE